MRFACLLLTLIMSAAPFVCAQSKQFLYLSAERIATLEIADDHTVLLNYFNLGKTYELLTAYQVVLLGGDQEVFRGHLFREDSPKDPADPFIVTEMSRPGEYAGYEIAGRYTAGAPASRALMKISGRILEFEPLTSQQFELVAARIGELDMGNPDRAAALHLAGFGRGYGKLTLTGTPEAEPLELFFPDQAVLPPVPIATPAPRLPSSDREIPDPVVVRVSVFVSRAGGLKDVTAVEGPNEKLKGIAVQTVRNSWTFLPAISSNKVAEAEMKLNVVFKR